MGPEQPLAGRATTIESSEKKNASFSSVLLWITFGLACAFAITFFVLDQLAIRQISTKKAEKAEIVAQLNSPTYKEVETTATNLKESFAKLIELSETQMPKRQILDGLYKYIDKDVKVTSISISSDGLLGIDATTSSYRGAADQMLALKAYNRISELQLGDVALDTTEGVNAKERVKFSLTSKIDLAKEVVVKTPETSADGSVQGSAGGTTESSSSEGTPTPSATTGN